MERLIKITVILVSIAVVMIIFANVIGLTSHSRSSFAGTGSQEPTKATGQARYVDQNDTSVHFNKPLKEEDLIELQSKYNFDTEFYPYYRMLNDEQKKAYYFIYDGISDMESDIYLGSILKISSNDIMEVVTAVYNDHPELFWMISGADYTYGEHHIVVTVSPHYNQLAGDLEDNKKQFEEKTREIVDAARAEAANGVVHQEVLVQDLIADGCVYDTNSEYNQSAYSCLVTGRSVCGGYARAFQHVMMQLGIPTYYVTGTTRSGGAHAWNIIKLQDKYYNVDVTWDDELGAQMGEDLHAFFNVSDAMLGDLHKRDDVCAELPDCDSEDLTYDKTIGATKKIQDINFA